MPSDAVSSAAPAAATATRSRSSSGATTPRVRCTCRRMVGADRADDAAQDAVVTALLSLDRLRDDDRFASWLSGSR